MNKFLKQFSVPLLIFILIIMIGWMVLQYVVEQDNQKMTIKTDVMAEQVGIRLHDFINTRISRLLIFRESMEDKVFTEAEFRSKALVIQHELTGFQAVNWINKEGIIQWVTPLSKNLQAFGVDLHKNAAADAIETFDRALLYRIDVATPQIKLIQGGLGFAIYLPIIKIDNVDGFVNGVFRIDDLVNQCFGNSIRDYDYEIILSGQSVFLKGDPENFRKANHISRYNFILYGQSWELQLISKPAVKSAAGFMEKLSLLVIVVFATLISIITLFRQKSRFELAEAYKIVEESETKFRTIFDKSPACLLRFNQEGEYTDWNRAAASLFGFEFPPRKPKHIHELKGMEPLVPAIEKALHGKNSDFYGFIEIQGKNIAVDTRIETLVSATDQIQGGIVLLTDVTEQNQVLHAKEVMYEIANLMNSVKQLPHLFESIHHVLSRVLDTRNFYVALYDEDTNEFRYPYYKDEFDSAPPSPVKGEKGLSAYILGEKRTVLFSKEEIYELHRKGVIDLIGTPSEQWLGSPLIVEGKTIGVMAVQSYSTDNYFDETDIGMVNFVSDQIAMAIKINLEDEKLRKSEMMYRELSAELSDSNNTKALLIDIITHDLKNPASVISGVADLLSMESETSEEIKLIKDSSDALLKVIENTSSLARVTLGENIEMSNIDISQIVTKVVNEFIPSFKKVNKPLVHDIEPGLSAVANPVISEIFRNYLSNALRYAPENKPVKCGLSLQDKEIRFFVEDVGKKIKPEDRKSIFQRRIQLKNGNSQGRGLGLAIVKRIADVHKARVGVESGEIEGNVFFMSLPVTVDAEANS
ncbi:MAG: GAF domain-containing protein [Candidatus Marinimicrobia bacterium]|nr:GAF domain-containing protein [Candidatus Neomarinimicrobiota bacterium]